MCVELHTYIMSIILKEKYALSSFIDTISVPRFHSKPVKISQVSPKEMKSNS